MILSPRTSTVYQNRSRTAVLCMYTYVCMYVHKLLLHFLTDFLQSGTKLLQIFPDGPVLFRIFNFAPAGATPDRFSRFFQEILPHTLSYASDQIFVFTNNVGKFKAAKK